MSIRYGIAMVFCFLFGFFVLGPLTTEAKGDTTGLVGYVYNFGGGQGVTVRLEHNQATMHITGLNTGVSIIGGGFELIDRDGKDSYFNLEPGVAWNSVSGVHPYGRISAGKHLNSGMSVEYGLSYYLGGVGTVGDVSLRFGHKGDNDGQQDSDGDNSGDTTTGGSNPGPIDPGTGPDGGDKDKPVKGKPADKGPKDKGGKKSKKGKGKGHYKGKHKKDHDGWERDHD